MTIGCTAGRRDRAPHQVVEQQPDHLAEHVDGRVVGSRCHIESRRRSRSPRHTCGNGRQALTLIAGEYRLPDCSRLVLPDRDARQELLTDYKRCGEPECVFCPVTEVRTGERASSEVPVTGDGTQECNAFGWFQTQGGHGPRRDVRGVTGAVGGCDERARWCGPSGTAG